MVEEYLKREEKEGRLRTIKERRKVLNRLVLPLLGARQINDISRRDIVRLLDRIADENGAPMADHTLAYLRRVMTWHASRSDDFRSPIVRGMARTSPSKRRRQRVLSDDELRAVWRAAQASHSVFFCLVRFLLLTATHRTEAAGMRRSEVSGEEWTVPQERYKTGLELVLPLSPGAQAALAKAPRVGKSGFVFTTDGEHPIAGFSKFKRAFDKQVLAELRKVADDSSDDATQAYIDKIEDLMRKIAAARGDKREKLALELNAIWWTLHDLRRTARSLMSRAGVPTDHAERCLGHVLPGVRGTYDWYEYARCSKLDTTRLDRRIEKPGAALAAASSKCGSTKRTCDDQQHVGRRTSENHRPHR